MLQNISAEMSSYSVLERLPDEPTKVKESTESERELELYRRLSKVKRQGDKSNFNIAVALEGCIIDASLDAIAGCSSYREIADIYANSPLASGVVESFEWMSARGTRINVYSTAGMTENMRVPVLEPYVRYIKFEDQVTLGSGNIDIYIDTCPSLQLARQATGNRVILFETKENEKSNYNLSRAVDWPAVVSQIYGKSNTSPIGGLPNQALRRLITAGVSHKGGRLTRGRWVSPRLRWLAGYPLRFQGPFPGLRSEGWAGQDALRSAAGSGKYLGNGRWV